MNLTSKSLWMSFLTHGSQIFFTLFLRHKRNRPKLFGFKPQRPTPTEHKAIYPHDQSKLNGIQVQGTNGERRRAMCDIGSNFFVFQKGFGVGVCFGDINKLISKTRGHYLVEENFGTRSQSKPPDGRNDINPLCPCDELFVFLNHERFVDA